MDKLDAYETLIKGSFEIRTNANDFFMYASASMVTIVEEDVYWVIEHIQRYGQDGLNVCQAYIQNTKPIEPYINSVFTYAMDELINRKQKVHGDIDWDFHYYNDNGPYRTINKD